MAIRILMMGLEKSLGSEANSGETLCVANNIIPLFWLLAFRHEDIQSLAVDGQAYPVLSIEKSKLQDRLKCYLPWCFSVWGKECVDQLNRWIEYLDNVSYPVIAVETYELWLQGVQLDTQKAAWLDVLLAKQFAMLTDLRAGDGLPADELLATVELDRQQPDEIRLAGFGWSA